MDDFELELRMGFLDEAAQLLADTEQCFLELERNSADKENLEKIFRLAHNLKGSAKAVGFGDMSEFTHHLESLLLKLKNGTLSIQSSTVTLLLNCNDHLRMWVETLKSDASAKIDSASLLHEIEAQLNGTAQDAATTSTADPAAKLPAEATASAAPQIENDPSASAASWNVNPNALLDDAIMAAAEGREIDPALTRNLESIVKESIKPAQVTNAVAAHASTPVATVEKGAPTPAAQDENIRVSLKRLEKLINNVGELVILQTVLNQQRTEIQSNLVQKTIGQLAKITKDIQDISMSLRMVPLKQTFQKMQRIVRDTSKALGKDIDLVLHGEETELDKTVVEHLGDPLVHLIRNAVDHGVENGDERVAKGKSKSGTVQLTAEHRGGQIVIEIKDDGRGLDAQKLRAKAIEKGVISASATLSEKDCHHLIFAPGFSTKSEVTDISGRGVGMDVVKTNIEKLLHGEVQLETVLGQGTTIRILLPLTLAIIDGMVVACGEERFIVPITQIHESVQPQKEDIDYVSGMGEVLGLRGETMPLFRLSNLMGRNVKNPKAPWESIALIVRVGASPFAVLVDDILRQQQVVIKQLGLEIRSLKGIAGGAILGDGRAALILELPELISRNGGRDRKTNVQRGVA